MNLVLATDHRLKTIGALIGFIFLISCAMMVLSTPLHEATHVVLSTLDPYVDVVEIHLFGVSSSHNEGHVLQSMIGCVVVKESYPGAFHDRPAWADLVQELICFLVQIVFTVYMNLRIISFLMNKNILSLQSDRLSIISSMKQE